MLQGEFLCWLPINVPLDQRTGFDISPKNIEVARQRFPDANFFVQDIFTYEGEPFDMVILGDIVEHIPDDVGFLRRCAQLGRYILLNLPLENCFSTAIVNTVLTTMLATCAPIRCRMLIISLKRQA